MQEMNAVVLQDCRTIMLHDHGHILLTIAANENTESTYSVPAPIGGYGGGSLVLSPTEKYLLFSYYSGQSEEAFMLFEIGAQGLDLVYEAGYVQGEGASYSFSRDDERLLQGMRTGWYCEEELQTDASGARYYPYGALNVLDIAQKRFTPHRIFVVPPATWQEGLTDQNYFELPATMQGNALSLAMPWGEEQIVFPIQEPIMFMPK